MSQNKDNLIQLEKKRTILELQQELIKAQSQISYWDYCEILGIKREYAAERKWRDFIKAAKIFTQYEPAEIEKILNSTDNY